MGRHQKLSPAERSEIRAWHKQGLSDLQIAARVGRSRVTVNNVLQAARSGVPVLLDWEPPARHLSRDERETIEWMLRARESFSDIARTLRRAPSTVTREVHANGTPGRYRASKAHKRAWRQSRRPKPTKLAVNPRLCAEVVKGLIELRSPEQISTCLRKDFPDDPMMRVSHETIYQSLYVQGRGELRRELARCLRTGRAQRIPHGRINTRGRIKGMVNISERPAEVDDRAVPGHWEGDLIMGTGNHSAVGTLVERATRFVMLLHLPDGHGPTHVRDAMIAAMDTLPATLRGSVTWDQGREMHKHLDFTLATGIDVYFCDPHKPWQRGSNENTNGLLRQYMPKGTSMRRYSADDLERIAKSLNGRPRKTLGWMTPSEKLAEVLASTG